VVGVVAGLGFGDPLVLLEIENELGNGWEWFGIGGTGHGCGGLLRCGGSACEAEEERKASAVAHAAL
jgi:hypothetical protein